MRVKYTRLLIHGMRHAGLYLCVTFALFLGAAAAVGAGLVKFQFFAFDPIRLYYVNVDMPPDAPIEETLRQTLRVEERVRAQLREGEARSVTSLAGIKFTEMEPLYGDQYGQIAVSLNPAAPDMRGLDDIIEGMRESVTQTPGRATISFLKISGGPPTAKPISVKVRADDREELRAAADAVKGIVAKIPGARDVVDNDTPGRDELSLRVDVNAARNAGLDPGLVARLVRLHVDGEVVADLRDRGEKVEVAGPRRAAHRGPDSGGAGRSHRPARWRHHDAGRAAGRRGTQEPRLDPALEPAPRHHRGGRSRQGTNRYPGREQSCYARSGRRSGRAIPARISIFPANSTTSTNRWTRWGRCFCWAWG